MNISAKMKQDWDRRAHHHARFWIATEDYADDQVFDAAGKATANAILRLLAGEGEGEGERAKDTSAWQVLDIGCGIGRVLRPLAEHFARLVGIDVSPEMIAQSKTWLHGVDNVETRETSGIDLTDFDDASFDLVYSYIAFQHMPRPVVERYLAESHRVLKPEGALVFQMYVGTRQEPQFADTLSLRVYDEAELDDLLRAHGFRCRSASVEHVSPGGLESRLVLCERIEPNQRESASAEWADRACDLDRSPLDERLYQHLASNYTSRGDRAMAKKTLEELVGFEPRNRDAWFELAAMYVEDGEHERALSVLSSANEHHDDEAMQSLLAQLRTLSRDKQTKLD